MAEKFPQQGAGENTHYTIDSMPHAQEFSDQKARMEEQLREIDEEKAALKKDRDTRKNLSPALFKRYGGEQVYQDKLAALNDEIINIQANYNDLQDLYKSLGGDKIDQLKAELLQRTGGKTRGTWSAEAMITFRELEKVQGQFESNYEAYQASQQTIPTGGEQAPATGSGDDTALGAGGHQTAPANTDNPITARGVANRLNAEGKEFSLDEYKKALAGEEEDSLQADKGLWTKLANIFRRKSHEEGDEKSWLDKMREKKIGRKVTAIVALGAAVLGVGVASGNSAEANNSQTVAAAKAFRNGDTPLDLSTAADRTDSNLDLAEGQEVGGSNEIDNEDIRGYRPELDPFFDEGKTAEYNMSNGFRTDVSPKEAMGLWQEDWENSPEMMSMIAAELGMEGSENPTSLDDLLTNSPDYYESWADKIEAMLGRATDVHYETLPAGTVYNTWYTALDENGDPQLVQSEGISHDHDVTLLVMTVQGKDGQEFTIKINSECGQGISAQMYDNVPVFIPDTGTPDQPVTPGDNTPPTPTTPGEGTPPPTTPGEDTPPTTPPEEPNENPTPNIAGKSGQRHDYSQPGDGSETDSGEGEKPLSQADSEAQNPAEVQQETSEGDSSSNQPGSETNLDAAGTNESSVDVSGSVEGAGDGQTNTDTVAGP